MKRNLKILGCFIIIFTLEIYFSIISNAAIETKPVTRATATQINAYQLCYDMRNPTSSLGNNSLDPHLELNKDYGAWAYLGMSAYGSNGANVVIVDRSYMSSTPNNTGVITANGAQSLTAGLYDVDGTNEIIKKYGNTKYLEVLDAYSDFTVEKTKGMALAETKGWYRSPAGDGSATTNLLTRRGSGGGWNSPGYGYSFVQNYNYVFRPVIWN